MEISISRRITGVRCARVPLSGLGFNRISDFVAREFLKPILVVSCIYDPRGGVLLVSLHL